MATVSNTTTYEISPAISEKLQSVRSLKRTLGLASAVLIGLAAFLVAMLCAMLIDWFTAPGNGSLRPCLTSAAFLIASLVTFASVGRVLELHSQSALAAAEIDRSNPAMEERWSTLSETVSVSSDREQAHPALFRQLATEANGWVPQVVPKQVVSRKRLKTSAVALGFALFLLMVPFVVDGQQVSVLLRRFFSPTTRITLTQFQELPTELVLAQGESLKLKTRLTGRIPPDANLTLLDENQRERQIHVDVDTVDVDTAEADAESVSYVSYRIPDVEKPFQFRWTVGDAQSPWVSVAVAKRPRLSAVRLQVISPKYTKRPVVRSSKLPRQMRVIEGSTLKIAFQTKEDVQEFRLNIGKNEQQLLEVDSKGWYRFQCKVTENMMLSAEMVESHGLKNNRPKKCRVLVIKDRAPRVKIISPNNEIAVQPNDTIDIQFTAKDDHGIEQAEMIVYQEGPSGEKQILKTIPIDLGEKDGAKKLNGSVELDLSEFELKNGQSIQYAVRVYDNHQASPTGASNDKPLEFTEKATEAPLEIDSSITLSRTESKVADSSSTENQSTDKTDIMTTAQPSAELTSNEKPADTANNTSSKISSNLPESSNSHSQTSKSNPSNRENSTSSPNNSIAETNKSRATSATNNKKQAGSNSSTSKQGTLTASNKQTPSTPTDSDSENKNSPSASNSPREQGEVSVPEGSVALKKNRVKKGDSKANDKAEDKTTNQNNDPGDHMTRRMLDIPQSSTSSEMTLKIDEFAGSFAGQRREKLAIAISPVLYQLDQLLAKAETITNGVAGRLEKGEPWKREEQKLTGRAEKHLARCEKLVKGLLRKTKETPYAFIGLELNIIIETHITEARDSLWEAQESELGRSELVRSAWQGITQARLQLEQLTKSFERIHREHKLAEKMKSVKKMYKVFIEGSLALLQPSQKGINSYQRQMAQFDLDEEYMKRLKEVLEMRNRMQAELARMLTDDPRLMRRFMDGLMNRGDTLRDQLTLLAERQKKLAREVGAWSSASEEERKELLTAIQRVRHTQLEEIALLAATHNEKLLTWLPLDLKAENRVFAEMRKASKEVAASAQLLVSMSIDEENRLVKGNGLYKKLGKLESELRHVELGVEHPGLANHLLNRISEVRLLTQKASSWILQTQMLEQGDYWTEAAIMQYGLAMETDRLAGKLADIESQLSSVVTGDAEMSAIIAEKAKSLLSTLDKEISANQLAATFMLRRQKGEAAVQREEAAALAFDKAEKIFDELMRTVIDELDKLPPQDPIASLLEDPTFDELMAQLENELQLAELLGIPSRPSNLRIISDWMRPNQNGSGGMGGNISAQLRRDAERNRRNADKAYRKALARARKEAAGYRNRKRSRASNGMRNEWNTLLSKLQEGLNQTDGELPPQEYREAIEQYLSRISKIEQPEAEFNDIE